MWIGIAEVQVENYKSGLYRWELPVIYVDYFWTSGCFILVEKNGVVL